MTAAIHRQVVDHARLLVRFLTALRIDNDRLFDRRPDMAAVADEMLERLGGLVRTCAEHDDSSPAPVTAVVDPDTARRTYGELVERICVKVTAVLAAGSVVAVVSRGDGPLLQLPGLTGWHFPQDENGVWAGFHPANGQHAVELVKDVREQGAQYLLIPSTGFWWLDFYEPLREYLRAECPVILEDADLLLFALPATHVAQPTSTAARRYERQRAQFVQFAGALLPKESTVSVVTRGDDALLALHGVRARHFPSDANGAYCGTPTSDEEALGELDHVISRGAEYLAVPHAMEWWLAMYPLLQERLLTRHRCIAERCEAGSIYQLSHEPEKEVR